MKYFVILVILILGIGVGVFLSNKLGFNFISKKTDINIISTVKEIMPIGEYASLVYHYSDVVTHSDARKIFGAEIPFTQKKAIYTIDGTLKLGFNGKNIKIDTSYNNIVVHMPKIEILSHEIYPETFSLYDEKTNLFNRYSLKDANEIQRNHKLEREKKVKENRGLYTMARESAEDQFRMLLLSLPEIKDNYKIIFEWEYDQEEKAS